MPVASTSSRASATAVLLVLFAVSPGSALALGTGWPPDLVLDLIFADSFETGDLCGWSSAIPPAGTLWHLDADGDGFGDPAVTIVACDAPVGYVSNGDDCDDGSALTFPGAAPLDSPTSCMRDVDDDEFGSSEPPAGVTPGSDCDDAATLTFPGAAPLDSPTACMQDLDDDQYGSSTPPSGVTAGSDCADTESGIHPGVPDDPDPQYVDQNCDGIDGDTTRAAFTAPDGSDQGSCGLNDPCLTVGFAAAAAAADPQRDQVYVRAGLYPEILDLPGGIAIFGGYDEAWQRADRHLAGHTVTVLGSHSAALDAYLTVNANQVTAALADVVLVGPDATPGGVSPFAYSSQVVHATDASLTFARVTFVQGAGEAGAPGSDGDSASQTPALTGGGGEDGESYTSMCDTSRQAGGAGGVGNCSGVATSGGRGGDGGSMDTCCSFGICAACDCTATNGLAGQPGVDGGGTGGAGGLHDMGSVPGPGAPGGQGADGAGGSGAEVGGSLESNGWHANAGGPGSVGTHGKGGGGGGGAGGSDGDVLPDDSSGPGGGGGGGGGCRAPSAGGGGLGAGGSFGILATDSALSIHDSEFALGTGGAGGQGGPGGLGQPGGLGGSGGAAAPATYAGGAGGAGGIGGHSGGGGGGAGGRVCGILTLGSTLDQAGNDFTGGAPGPGGPGGASPGNNGASGASGELDDICTCASAADC